MPDNMNKSKIDFVKMSDTEYYGRFWKYENYDCVNIKDFEDSNSEDFHSEDSNSEESNFEDSNSEESNSEDYNSEEDREEETDFEELSETDQEIRQICDSLIYKYLIEKRYYKTAELLRVEREVFYTLTCKNDGYHKNEKISGCLFVTDSTQRCITAGSKRKRRKLGQSPINVTSSYDYVAGCICYSGCCCFLGPEKISKTFSLMIANFPRSTMIGEIVLPEKILIQILSYLDFKTVQKACTQVSKSWLELIRSSKLSREMKLPRLFRIEEVDFNAFFNNWKNLRVLHFSSGDEPGRGKFAKSLKTHKSLKKIVIPCKLDLYEDRRRFRWVWPHLFIQES